MTIVKEDDVITVATSVGNRNVGNSHVPVLGNNTGSCKYTYADGSHCLVGAIAKGFGWDLPSVNSTENALSIRELTFWLEKTQNVVLTDSSIEILERIQQKADEGFYWNDAVKAGIQ